MEQPPVYEVYDLENKIGKGTEKRIKFFVASAVFVIALIAIIFFCISSFSDGIFSENIIVYKSNDGFNIRIGNLEKIVSDESAADFKCDKENKRVFYSVESSYADGVYDLYFIEKKRSELTEPKIIDYGIERNYILNSGKIFYTKKNTQAGALDAFCCDFDKSTVETFSSNVENIYPVDNSNTIFFIKLHADNRVLYKYSTESPIEICRDIVDIHLYNDCDSPHLIYETKSKIYNGMTELYRTEAEGAPELICDNTYRVMYEEYIPDGNLYYFTSSQENISWSYVIADEYSESDKTLTRPIRDTFLSILGISVEYNEKLREYQDKLVRDEIREALNESVEKGEFSAPVYTAFAYNSDGSHKVAEKINPDAVYATASFGLPKLIFESSEIIESETDMASLVEIAQRSTINEVIEYARSVVNNSIKSTGIKISGQTDNGISVTSLEGYSKTNTMFNFSRDGKRIYAFERDSAGERLKLYSCEIGSDLKLSQKVNINNGISSYGFTDNSVIYLKSDIGKNTGDIYSYSGDENIKLSNAANAMKIVNSKEIIVMKNYDDSTELITADYYIVDEKEENLVSEKVNVGSFSMNNSGDSAYVAESEKSKALFICSDGISKQIDDGVIEILLFI